MLNLIIHYIRLTRFTTGESEESQRATKISPRWPTKVFAVECSRKIYAVCKSDPAHFDLTLAQKRKSERGGNVHKYNGKGSSDDTFM